MKKIIFIVIDGLADEKIPAFGYKTPLEKASTPNLDFLAKEGVCGLVKPFLLPNQEKPSSESTHIALFGYQKYFLGRGPYEAVGIGMKLKKGDVALRGNFASVDEDLIILDRRAQRISDTKPLIDCLKKIKIKGARIFIEKSWGHRLVVVLRGKNISEKISDNDPKEVNVKVKRIFPLQKSISAKFTAKILNQFLEKCHYVLKIHPLNEERIKKKLLPANYILLRGAGRFEKTPSFKEKYKLKAAFIAGGALYKGIARILGMEEIRVKGATGFSNTNLEGKFLAAKKFIKKYDFIFLHIKATDNLAEDGDFLGKKNFIERIDKYIKPIINLKDTLIVITGDHPTSSLKKSHIFDKNPLLIFGNGKDSVCKFSEKECQKGKLGILRQTEVMKLILKLAKA
jgi:2,3-bisphosphoglycerate-independent phosphoglycerate mutase